MVSVDPNALCMESIESPDGHSFCCQIYVKLLTKSSHVCHIVCQLFLFHSKFLFNREVFPEYIALRKTKKKTGQGVVMGFHLGEVVDLLKSSGDCLFVSRSGTPPAWVWLFQKLWLLHGLPAKQQLIEASTVSPQWSARTNSTHIFSFHSCPSHAGRVCLPYLSAKAVQCDEKCYSLFFSHLLFLSLAGEYAAQGHLPAHPGKTRTAGESEVPQRWYWRTSYVIMSGMKPVIEIHSKH